MPTVLNFKKILLVVSYFYIAWTSAYGTGHEDSRLALSTHSYSFAQPRSVLILKKLHILLQIRDASQAGFCKRFAKHVGQNSSGKYTKIVTQSLNRIYRKELYCPSTINCYENCPHLKKLLDAKLSNIIRV